MKGRLKTTLASLALLLMLAFSSCQSLIMGLAGMHQPRLVEDSEVMRLAKKFDIPEVDLFRLGVPYRDWLKGIDTLQHSLERKHRYQPLQALYFDRNRQISSYHINCNATGFPNLHWDRDSILASFPPRQQTEPDSLLPFESHIKFLMRYAKSSPLQFSDDDFVVIVHWTTWMGRQSKRLIHFVQENAKLAGNLKVRILFVNGDEIYSKSS